MGNFFKSFGKGILYVLVLPVLLVVLVLYAIEAIIVFLIMSIKGLVLFFTGRSLFDDLPEDKKAKEILLATAGGNLQTTPENNAEVATGQVSVDQSIYNNPSNVDEDPFYVPEYLKEPRQENNQDENPQTIPEEDYVNENDITYINKTNDQESPLDDSDTDDYQL